MRLLRHCFSLVLVAITLTVILGCDSKAKKSDDKPVDLPPAGDPSGAVKDAKGKIAPIAPSK